MMQTNKSCKLLILVFLHEIPINSRLIHEVSSEEAT